MTEKVSDVCREVAYHAVWLENEYLRVMVLPELGGRIHRALDKTNGYDLSITTTSSNRRWWG